MSTTTVERPQAPPLSRGVSFLVLILFALIPLISHGCHGDDVDHEPSVLPVCTQTE